MSGRDAPDQAGAMPEPGRDESAANAGARVCVGAGPLAWLGGKCRLARRILAHIPPHVCYCEPFAGGAWVFFKKEPSQVEVLNDINGELVNFYRVLAANPAYFENKFRFALYSRQIFMELKKADPANLGAEERAWRFFYLNAASFLSAGHTFRAGLKRGESGRFVRLFHKKLKTLMAAHERLKLAIIERLDWRECLEFYDGPNTFFYLDPPYFGHERDYGKGVFGREDFLEMAERLKGLSGRFILSINDRPEIREIFGDFRIAEEVAAHYSMSGIRQRKNRELLLANFQYGEAGGPSSKEENL